MSFFSLILQRESFHAFRYLDFRRFIFSKFMITIAQQVQFVVLSWQVYEITHDPLSLGLLGLAEAIPAVSFSLAGGYVADKINRKKILAWVGATLVLCTSYLLFLSMETVAGTLVTAVPFYAVMFIIGIGRGFYSPAQFSLMTQLIPREAYANSSAWNSTFWHVAVVVGSASGGLLLAWLGKPLTYFIVLCCVLVSLFQILRIRAPHFDPIPHAESAMQSIRSGLKFVFGNKIILGAMSLDLVAVLFGGATAMLPVFASDVLHVGERGFGFLRAAPFAGAVLMALYMTKNPPLRNAGKKLMICVSGFALCMIAFALSRSFMASLLILALSGAFDNVSVVIRSTIIQLFTPENMRGRVSSVSTMFISSSNEIGAFESGFAARILGLIPSVIFGGAVALSAVSLAAWKLPSLRRLELKT